MKSALRLVAQAFALSAGLVTTAIAALTCWSVISRSLLGTAVIGDFELVQVAMAMAVAGFLPLCQFEQGNIIVDFFTQRVNPTTRGRLDRFGALMVALMMGLLAWRTTLGAIETFRNGQVTMMMRFPEWIAYGAMAPALGWTGLIALWQAVSGSTDTAPA